MGILSALLDLYENTRKTKTDVKSNKEKKIDCPVYKPSPKNKISAKEIDCKNEPEGR